MHQLVKAVEEKYQKPKVVDVRSGDTVRVHQKIKEGSKERVQVFEGFVIRTRRKNSATSAITVRRVASGVGVEKTFLLHSPLIVQVEVTKRSKVRRKYLSYMRDRHGKSARLSGIDFDKDAVNLSIEEQQNVDAGLDKDADTEAIEQAAADEKQQDATAKAEEKPKANEEKASAENKEEKEEPADAPQDKSDEKPTDTEESPEKMSKEEKAKAKKEKAQAFQQEQEKK